VRVPYVFLFVKSSVLGIIPSVFFRTSVCACVCVYYNVIFILTFIVYAAVGQLPIRTSTTCLSIFILRVSTVAYTALYSLWNRDEGNFGTADSECKKRFYRTVTISLSHKKKIISSALSSCYA